MNLWQYLQRRDTPRDGQRGNTSKSAKVPPQVTPSVPRIDIALRVSAFFMRILLDARLYFLAAILVSALIPERYGNFVAAFLVAIGALLVYRAERWHRIPNHLYLLAWADLNKPLLRRLSLEAPGTYAHTMVIANLCESACNAIGADGLLGRVGAYYHDIGKLRKPQHFVENQPRGRNPHDKLKPNTSASIIRNHVREGLELAEEYRVPKEIRAFIAEHHGTIPIAFFLEKARERDGTVNQSDFTYQGPIPQSIETAICMLADGVEAKVRALPDPASSAIKEAVDELIKLRIEQGQLNEAPITLQQLTAVRDQFVRTLTAMYHGRIEYPTAAQSASGTQAPSAGDTSQDRVLTITPNSRASA